MLCIDMWTPEISQWSPSNTCCQHPDSSSPVYTLTIMKLNYINHQLNTYCNFAMRSTSHIAHLISSFLQTEDSAKLLLTIKIYYILFKGNRYLSYHFHMCQNINFYSECFGQVCLKLAL